jgi:aspartate carbamoyltransferase catalytic subunit
MSFMTLRHLVSINDLTREGVEAVFSLADSFLEELGDPHHPQRIARSTDLCRGSVMATLFYEPSTRTRLSFESAMSRLGGKVISSADPSTSSAAKGESLADTVRMASAYADILTLRHPRDGAAKAATGYASVPVINAGDGAHEHPTQTLCDLFTIRREKGVLAGLTVAVLGDLKGGRTVHSLVHALARFGATIITMPAGGMNLPKHVDRRLRNEFGYTWIPSGESSQSERRVTGAYVPEAKAGMPEKIDVLYVTRFQKERATQSAAEYPVVDTAFLSMPKFRETLVLHPLPRVGELDPAFDTDARAGYFRQASLGVPIRMALTALLLDAAPQPLLEQFARGFAQDDRDAVPKHDVVCLNPNCISRSQQEMASILPRSHSIAGDLSRLRCSYCEHESAR